MWGLGEDLVRRMREAAIREAIKLIGGLGDLKVIGVGTGSTVRQFIEIATSEGIFDSAVLVPSSIDTALALSEKGFRVASPLGVRKMQLYVDSADEVDSRRNMIKGGGGAMTMEKILTYYSDLRVFIVDEFKLVDRLGAHHPVPVEVLRDAVSLVIGKLRELGFKVRYRVSEAKKGPTVSDLGGVIVDVSLPPSMEPEEVSELLDSLPGVISHGLFVGLADYVFVGRKDGGVTVLR